MDCKEKWLVKKGKIKFLLLESFFYFEIDDKKWRITNSLNKLKLKDGEFDSYDIFIFALIEEIKEIMNQNIEDYKKSFKKELSCKIKKNKMNEIEEYQKRKKMIKTFLKIFNEIEN